MIDILYKYFDDFTETQIQQFQLLLPLYKEWNEKINVISRKDIDQIYLHHVLHSLSIAVIADFNPGTTAIFFPEVKFLLVDSIAKKLKVVEAVCEAANITNITTQHTRAEEIKNRKFDFAVSRAVAPLKDLWQWASPLLKKRAADETHAIANGLICLKGGDLHQEISDSLTRPKMMSVYKIFQEEYFMEKHILHVTK